MWYSTGTMRKIGAHVSAAGGLHLALERADEIGCNAVQLFSGSPRVWAKKPVEQIVTEQFHETRKKLGISPVVTHALYLVNLASDKPESVQKSINSLKYELEFDAAVHGGGVVVHLGSHQGRGFENDRQQVADAMAEILKSTPENSTFLMENAAGQNGKVGGALEELQWLAETLEKSGKWISKGRLGWCFDTCHAFAGGYYLGEEAPTAQLAAAEKIGREPLSAVAEIKRLGLWETLKCVHVNDSRDPFGSGRDRHENLGDGEINSSDMQHFLMLPEVLELPLILEVPGIEKTGPDAENVRRLQSLVAG